MSSTAIIVIAIVIGVVAIPLAGIIQSYMLEKEKIKADMVVRTEEVRAKNQLEIERLMHSPDKSAASARDHLGGNNPNKLEDLGLDKREVRERQR